MPSPSPDELDELLGCALRAAHEAGEIALGYFQTGVAIELKADQTPVTRADRECEEHLRRRIEERFPHHGILGEEWGAARPHASYRWMLDPIDGTQTFIRGVPLWGVMVGLEYAGEALLGVVRLPALGETVWARRGGGAWWNGRRARVSAAARLGEATLVLTDARGFAPAGFTEAFERLRAQTKFERTWGDCYGHLLVATGRAEVMLDPLLSEWDACALLPILEEAGGCFRDWQGRRTIRGGNAIATNAALLAAVLEVIGGDRPSG